MAKKMTAVTDPTPNASTQREANMNQVQNQAQATDVDSAQDTSMDQMMSPPPSPAEVKTQVASHLSTYESLEQERIDLLQRLDGIDQEQSQVVGQIHALRGPGKLAWKRPDGTQVVAKIAQRRLQGGRGEDAGRPYPGGPRFAFRFEGSESVETF